MKSLRTEPSQDRSRARIEAIVNASKEHFAKVGPEKFNTETVAGMAGCSVGTIYRYFSSREVLLDIVAPHRDPDGSRTQKIVDLVTDETVSDYSKIEGIKDILELN